MRIEACHEDWSKMTPNDQGRHCSSCNLTVVNLKDKTIEEVESLKEEKGKICGRVSKFQFAEFQYLHPLKRFAIALFLVFGTGLFTTSYAQVIEQTSKSSVQEHKYTIKFRATNLDGTPLQGVYINFDTNADFKEGSTDESGELSLSFLDPAKTKKVYVNISYGDFYGTIHFEANSGEINNFDRIVYDAERNILKVGKLEIEEVFIMGDIAPVEWEEELFEQKTEHN